jgi:TetR/AcrR family transcriptional regulator
MASTRRIGAEDSATRGALLDAAQLLMLEEGYAAVTSRRVAARAGLKPQLVHYYFRTMDDLFLALVRRGAEQNLERYTRALSSPRPLRAMWELSNDPARTAFTMELSALANHRKAIRAELADHAERFRALQVDAMRAVLARSGVDEAELPAEAVAMLVTSTSLFLAMEQGLGVGTGHDEVRALVERWIDRLEGGRAPD